MILYRCPHERERGDLLRRLQGNGAVGIRRSLVGSDVHGNHEPAGTAVRYLRPGRLGRVAGEEPGIALIGIDAPEQEDIAAVPDLSQRGRRAAAALGGQEPSCRRIRGGAVHGGAQEIG